MARSKPAAAGHNSTLSEDDEAALWAKTIADYRKAQRAADLKKAEYDQARAEVTSVCAMAKAELGVKRKDVEDVVAKLEMDDDEFRAEMAATNRRYALAGLPVGAQLDMFAAGAPDTVDEMAHAYNKGKRAGLAGDDPTPPKTLHPSFIPEWQRGWADGQDDLGKKMIRAMEIIAARANAGKMAAVEEEEEGVEEDPDLDAKARKLKRSGWAEPTAEEAAVA